MLSRSVLSLSVGLMLLTVACGNASFFGGGSKRKQPVPVATSPNGTNPNGTNPNGTNPNGTNPNGTNPNGTNPNGTNPNGTNPNGTNPNGTYPYGQNCNGGPCQQPQIGPNSQIVQPNPNTVIFGKDQVFHIGDGRFPNSTCKEEISALPLLGGSYFFQFEVQADQAQVVINVARICGVDYATNTFELRSVNARFDGQMLPRGVTTISGQPVTLSRGVYSVWVKSGFGRDPGEMRSDRDDFIVGNVTIQANQPVRPIRYGAYLQ